MKCNVFSLEFQLSSSATQTRILEESDRLSHEERVADFHEEQEMLEPSCDDMGVRGRCVVDMQQYRAWQKAVSKRWDRYLAEGEYDKLVHEMQDELLNNAERNSLLFG